MVANNWNKFCLIIWKNWLIKSSHKKEFFYDIWIPLLPCVLFLLLRWSSDPEYRDKKTFDSISIDTLEPLK